MPRHSDSHSHGRGRRIVVYSCNGCAILLLVAVIVLGAVGVSLPFWARLKPNVPEEGVERDVQVGLFAMVMRNKYPTCLLVAPFCRASQRSFNIEGGNVTSNWLDVNIPGCWASCYGGRLMITGVLDTKDYLSKLEARIANSTQSELVPDMTIPVRCRNFVAPRGMIIAGLATTGAALIFTVLGMKFVALNMVASCLCTCAFVVQLIGFILASVYSVRPCDRMNESWNYQLGSSFIVTLISTALLLIATLITTCAVIAQYIGKGAQVAAGAIRAGGEEVRGIGEHVAGMVGDHRNSVESSAGQFGSRPQYGMHRGSVDLQRDVHHGTSGIQIPITAPSNMPNVPMSGFPGLHGPAIVTHTTHTEERTYTQPAEDRV